MPGVRGQPNQLKYYFLSPCSQNNFVAILDLPEGEHQYKFFVDGQWTHDPSEVLCLQPSALYLHNQHPSPPLWRAIRSLFPECGSELDSASCQLIGIIDQESLARR